MYGSSTSLAMTAWEEDLATASEDGEVRGGKVRRGRKRGVGRMRGIRSRSRWRRSWRLLIIVIVVIHVVVGKGRIQSLVFENLMYIDSQFVSQPSSCSCSSTSSSSSSACLFPNSDAAIGFCIAISNWTFQTTKERGSSAASICTIFALSSFGCSQVNLLVVVRMRSLFSCTITLHPADFFDFPSNLSVLLRFDIISLGIDSGCKCPLAVLMWHQITRQQRLFVLHSFQKRSHRIWRIGCRMTKHKRWRKRRGNETTRRVQRRRCQGEKARGSSSCRRRSRRSCTDSVVVMILMLMLLLLIAGSHNRQIRSRGTGKRIHNSHHFDHSNMTR